MAEEMINHQDNLDFIDELRFLNEAVLKACEKYDEMLDTILNDRNCKDQEIEIVKAKFESIKYIYEHGFKENPSSDLLQLKKKVGTTLKDCNAYIANPDDFYNSNGAKAYYIEDQLSPYLIRGVYSVEPTATEFRTENKRAVINKEIGIVWGLNGESYGDAWLYHKNGEKKRPGHSLLGESVCIDATDTKKYYSDGKIEILGSDKEPHSTLFQSGRIMSTRELDSNVYIDTLYYDNDRHAIRSLKHNEQEVYAEYKSGNVKFKKEDDLKYSYWDNEKHSVQSIEKNGEVIYAEYENGQTSMKQEEIEGKVATKYYSENGELSGIRYNNCFVAFNQQKDENIDALEMYKKYTQNKSTSYSSSFARITRGQIIGTNTCDMDNGQKAIGVMYEDTYYHESSLPYGGGIELSWRVATAVVDTKRNAIIEAEPSMAIKVRDQKNPNLDIMGEIDKTNFLSVKGNTAYAKIKGGVSICSFDDELYQKILEIAENDKNSGLSLKIKNSMEKIEKEKQTAISNNDLRSPALLKSNSRGRKVITDTGR